MTDTTLVSGVFLTPGVALAIVDAFAKFKERGFNTKYDHVTQTTPLSGEFLPLGWDLLSSIHLPNLNIVASSIPEIIKGE